MEYLFPVPARPLKSLLESKAARGEEFTEHEATLDVMLMMDKGKMDSERALSKRWKWSPSRVHRTKDALAKMADEWRCFGVKQTEAEVKQPEAKSSIIDTENAHSEAQVKQSEAQVKQSDILYTRATDTELRTTDINNKPTARPQQRRKDRSQDIDFDEVLRSWNEFAAPLSLPTCRSMNAKRKAAVRQRFAEVWPNIEEVYNRIRGSGFLLGTGPRSWVVTFDFIWCRSDGAQKILEGAYDDGHKNRKARNDSRDADARSNGTGSGSAPGRGDSYDWDSFIERDPPRMAANAGSDGCPAPISPSHPPHLSIVR